MGSSPLDPTGVIAGRPWGLCEWAAQCADPSLTAAQCCFFYGRAATKRSRLVGITHREVWFGYESKPWYPSEPQITGKWMFIPPNIARLVLIHPHIIWVGGHLIGPQMADMFMNHNVVSRNRDMSTIWDPKLSNHGVLSVSNGIAEMLKVKCHHLQTYLQYCHTAYALLDTYIYITSSIVFGDVI